MRLAQLDDTQYVSRQFVSPPFVLWKSESFLWLGIVTLSCETGSFITMYETHF
jgi:hypothetical protein